jgi:hypothetical protein
MKPPLPVYIGENMFAPKVNYWLVAGIVITLATGIAIYYYNKIKTPAIGKDTL